MGIGSSEANDLYGIYCLTYVEYAKSQGQIQDNDVERALIVYIERMRLRIANRPNDLVQFFVEFCWKAAEL